MPLVLIHLMMEWLTDRECAPLLLTRRHICDQVQAFYKPGLRPIAAQRSASYIASCRISVNLVPAWVPMKEQGEATFQMCLKMKATGLPDAAYRHGVLTILRRCLAQSNDPYHLLEVSTGVALGLGGTLMTAEDRDALLACILGSCTTSTSPQLKAVMLGVGTAFGNTNPEHQLVAALKMILAYCATSTPEQMASMMRGLFARACRCGWERRQFKVVLALILGANKTCSARQIGSMIHTVGLLLGGGKYEAGRSRVCADHDTGVERVGSVHAT